MGEGDRVFRTIQLGALLHDIGKFLQKGNNQLKGKHPLLSKYFIEKYQEIFKNYIDDLDYELLIEIVMRHHERAMSTKKINTKDKPKRNYGGFPDEMLVQTASPNIKSYCLIVSRADNYSSAERDRFQLRYKRSYKTGVSASVFLRIKLFQEKINKDQIFYYQPKMLILDKESYFPKVDVINPKESYDKLFGDFDNLFNKVNNKFNNYEIFFNELVNILHKYTWVASSCFYDKIPDVSLFDHLKTTSAIAVAMYLYHKDFDTLNDLKIIKDERSHNKFCLLVGDFSGIQNYLFSGLKYTSQGAAKTLRARSFILTILIEVIAQIILEEFNLPIVNNIISSGGKFYLLLPNTSGCEGVLEELQRNIDNLLLKRFYGDICLNLGYVEFKGADFKEFNKIVARASQKLGEQKAKPFTEILKKNQNGFQNWNEEIFVRELAGNKTLDICRGCEKAYSITKDDEIPLCNHCAGERNIGKQLVSSDAIYLYKNIKKDEEKDLFYLIDNYYFSFKPHVSEKPWRIINFNEYQLAESKAPTIYRFLANYIPFDKINDKPLTFDEIGKKAEGDRLLGYLKADVDNLGSIFACGFIDDNKGEHNYGTISRVTTFSRMLDLFFAGHINTLLKDEFRNCYTVYSGGDDLFIIGPWNQIIDLAERIRDDFAKFTGTNPDLTLSAGIGIVKTKTPIAYGADLANRLLGIAKEKPAYGSIDSQDQVCIFGETMKWEVFKLALNEAKKLSSFKPKASFLNRLWNYYQMYLNYRDKNQPEGLRYLPLLHYDLARNYQTSGEDFPGLQKWCKENIFELKPKGTRSLIDSCGFIFKYIINSIRKRED